MDKTLSLKCTQLKQEHCMNVQKQKTFMLKITLLHHITKPHTLTQLLNVYTTGNSNTYIITIEIQISRCFGVYNIYTYILHTYIYPPGHHKLCDASSAGDIAKIVAHL